MSIRCKLGMHNARPIDMRIEGSEVATYPPQPMHMWMRIWVCCGKHEVTVVGWDRSSAAVVRVD